MNWFLDVAEKAWSDASSGRVIDKSASGSKTLDSSSPLARLVPSLELPPELVDLGSVESHERLTVRFRGVSPRTEFRIELFTPVGGSVISTEQVLRVLSDYLHLVRALRPGALSAEPRVLLGFWWNSDLRRLPRDDPGAAIGVRHVNGGLCWKMHDLILVYRAEEWRKVLLHELFHFFGLDEFRVRERTTRLIATEYRIRSDRTILLQEAYTEALATVFYVSYCAYQPNMSRARFRREWRRLMEVAKEHFLERAALLFLHFRESDGWHETTNAFAYFVCKAAFLRDTLTFLKFVKDLQESRKTPADAFALEALLKQRTALASEIAQRAPQAAAGSSSLAMLPASLVPPS